MSTEANGQPEGQVEAAPARKAWGGWFDASLLLGVGLFLAYRFLGTGFSTAPAPQGVALLPPSDRPSFVELSGTR